MEFPDLGQHCSETTCNRLDFLPMKCDACEKSFCKDHIRYDDHHCASAYKNDVQVPVCPLCCKPVPVPRGETPDIKVGEHIDRDCQSDPAKKKRKAYSNRCSASRCKQKELIRVICDKCRKNFCLRHRHPQDHNCQGFQGTGRSVSNTGFSALQRHQASSSKQRSSKTSVSNPPQHTYLRSVGLELHKERQQRREEQVRTLQNNMSEEEALQRALQLSSMEHQETQSMTQEERDLALARQLQKEEEENRNRIRQEDQRRRNNNTNESSCQVS